MHTSRNDYLINTLRFVSAKEATQIYGAILPESLTSPEMKETKAYKTYLGFATGATPPKKVRKFKKPASPKLPTVPVSPEEPMGKSKRVKRPAKKSTKTPAKGGNDEDDSNNKKESSGEESDHENDSDDDKTHSDDENESYSDHETLENESGLESDQEENEEDEDDEEEEKDEFVKTQPNNSNDEDETQITDKAEGDEDEEMDYTTSQLYDDKTEVSVTSSSHSSDLATKFLNFSDVPYTDAEIVSPIDVHIHHEVPSKQTPTLLTVLVSVITDSSPSGSSKSDKSQPKSSGKSVQSEELEFEVADSDMPQDQEENPVPVDYFFNNDLKYLQGGILTMTYTTSLTKTKAAQYDLPGIEDMVPNIWVLVKVSYDKHALWGISHWIEQRKTFYGYARGLESSHDVYFMKHILAVTHVEEGDFPRLRINDIEDMLLLVVQNWLTNLSGDDVSDFAIALRMFTRSLVI
ncbi:hypothetical protein Tco_1225108 [Tanacetum coccineum]